MNSLNKLASKTSLRLGLSKLIKIAYRISFPVFLREGQFHIHPSDVRTSDLSDELKKEFIDAIKLKENFEDVTHETESVDRLQRISRHIIFVLKGLFNKLQIEDSSIHNAIQDLESHEFVPGLGLNHEINSWSWTAHEVISKMFDLAVDEVNDLNFTKQDEKKCVECGVQADGITNDDYYCQECIDELFVLDKNKDWVKK